MSATEYTPEELDARELHGRCPVETLCTVQELAAQIAQQHGITTADMLGRSRYAHLVSARRDLYRVLRTRGWSYPAIGRACGNRDHTSIMYALGALPAKARRYAASKGPITCLTK